MKRLLLSLAASIFFVSVPVLADEEIKLAQAIGGGGAATTAGDASAASTAEAAGTTTGVATSTYVAVGILVAAGIGVIAGADSSSSH